MGCDMVVALGSATVGGQAILGLNSHAPYGTFAALERTLGRPHEPGEMIRATHIELPQARVTYDVLGCRSQTGWGYQSGINEHQMAIGCASWRSRLEADQAGLTGADLVRLGLERSKSAQQAVDVLTDLIARHGQGWPGDDALLLIADVSEAFLLEAAGPYWAYLECHEVRAVSSAAMIHQDWNRVSHGLSDHAIAQGWWRDDGNKIDFARSLGLPGDVEMGALKRWGRATRHLQQQNGHIDVGFLRRLLSDHFEETSAEVQPLLARPGTQTPLCRHARMVGQSGTTFSFIAALSPDNRSPAAWVALGPLCASVYFPLFVAAALPDAFTGNDSLPRRTQQILAEAAGHAEAWTNLQESLGLLQERFDQQMQEFESEADALRHHGEGHRIPPFAEVLMQNQVEQYRNELDRLQARVTAEVLRDY